MSAAAADTRPTAAVAAATLDPDILATVIEETARRVEARAARPSPIHLRSWAEIERFAEKAAKSGMVPKDYVAKPDAICIAVQLGSELGLAPMQSVQNIAVINGRPALWGDAMIGLCRASGISSYIREWSEGEGESQVCYCEAKRKDDPNPVRQSFSVKDAKLASLWGKAIWSQYPQRMLQMRARGFALRDAFPDVLKGLLSAEEARDIPWEDTGLSIGLPPVATGQPITGIKLPSDATTERMRSAATTPPKRTAREFLEGLRLAVADAKRAPDAAEQIDRILCADEVMRAKDTLKGDALAELTSIISDGLQAMAPVSPEEATQ